MNFKGLFSWFWNPCKHTKGFGEVKRVWVKNEYGSHWKYYKECVCCGEKVKA